MKAHASAIETSSPSLSSQLGVCAIIILLIWIVFGQTLGHDFVNYDDKTYVYGNSLVVVGLSPHGLSQAFVDTQTNNWHPLTVISHMIDCQLYDLKAGGHHFTNVLLHTIAAVLLFFWLRNVTGKGQSGSDWSSAFVTALFAIHPLRVESVAWVAERKDVLSGVFFFLTLGAYVRYTRARSFGRYLTMSIFLACGLMSKPMLVTTPAVLLLLDYWPLKRIIDGKSFWRMTFEKLPLFALSAAASIIAFSLQVHSSSSVGQLPFGWRLENALVTYVTYIWQMFWPANLAVFYPHPDNRLAFWQVALAATFLIAMTWVAFVMRRNRPYLLVGWLWYVIMLLPVIGIVEVGLQGQADRYTYLPHVGLSIALVWLVGDVARSLPHRREILATVGCGIVIILSACAWKQTTYWRNSDTLWTRALAVTTDNDVALTNLGTSLMERGQLDDALSYFQRALAVRSRSEHRHYNLSLALIHDSVGNVLARKGRLDDAIVHFRQAIELRPDFPDAHYNLGTALFQKGDLDDAIAEWRTTLSIHPFDAGTHTSLGNALVQKGWLREAVDHYEKALQTEPDSILPLNNLAWVMSTGPDDSLRNNEIAVQLATKANQLSKESNPIFIRTLAAAYAQAGQFEKAIETARRALEQANAQGTHDLASQIQEELDLYQRHAPLRDPSLRNAR
ncbi:MAG: protein O-mannosyl-transferase [Verrucomicrobiota bacterium]